MIAFFDCLERLRGLTAPVSAIGAEHDQVAGAAAQPLPFAARRCSNPNGSSP
ncbi:MULTISPECIES: hypothetical protein [Streptomyces]|uniref:hypothetical protein n=1 Tax=Streptomyces TaxID=1883 RepID=UPI00131C8894|nr:MULTISPECIES: hypothetical protein [Streptomyces]